MAVKKSKRPALRYLLSADARLRRLSLKKLSEQKKASASKRPARAKAPVARPAESIRWPGMASPVAISLAVVGVVAAVTLITAGPPSESGEYTGTSIVPAAAAHVASAPSPAPPVPAEKPARPAKPTTSTPVKPRATTPAAVAAIASAPEPPAPEPPAPGTVTITGCLAKSKDAFWLKDASGADLSKARSWRTGFFKKSSPRIDIVAASAGVKLSDHVGQRVSATGVLEERELRARSVRGVATSCN